MNIKDFMLEVTGEEKEVKLERFKTPFVFLNNSYFLIETV